MKPSVVIVDRMGQVLKGMAEIPKRDVLIGFPEKTTERDDDEDQSKTPTNAQIGYAMEFGVPQHNVPARPFLVPGVRKAGDEVAEALKEAAQQYLEGNLAGALQSLNEAGQAASTAVKDKIIEGPFAALAPATVAGRARARGTTRRRKGEKHYLKLIAAGKSAAEAQQLAGIRPLINTGQMLRAVTYVVRTD
jgi:hypothetical protein